MSRFHLVNNVNAQTNHRQTAGERGLRPRTNVTPLNRDNTSWKHDELKHDKARQSWRILTHTHAKNKTTWFMKLASVCATPELNASPIENSMSPRVFKKFLRSVWIYLCPGVIPTDCQVLQVCVKQVKAGMCLTFASPLCVSRSHCLLDAEGNFTPWRVVPSRA